MSRSSHYGWKAAIAGFIAVACIGGILLYRAYPSDGSEAFGLTLLVVGILGLVICALGAWITRQQPKG